MSATSLIVVSALLLAAVPPAPSPQAFEAEWRAWHDQRLASLARPQGWLALTGLHWLKEGENRIPGLPGLFTVAGGAVTLTAAAADGWTLGGAPVTSRRLASDRDGKADRIMSGSRAAQVMSGAAGWRCGPGTPRARFAPPSQGSRHLPGRSALEAHGALGGLPHAAPGGGAERGRDPDP